MDQLNFMLCLLIPGKSSPGKDFDLFMEPLYDDLHALWNGVRIYDAFQNGMFDLRAAALWCIHDYPACSTMSGRTTKGYAACMYCDKEPLSKSIKNKLCYIAHHRFLRYNHRLRGETGLGEVHESKSTPRSFTPVELEAELEKVKHLKPGIESASRKRKRGEPTPIRNRSMVCGTYLTGRR